MTILGFGRRAFGVGLAAATLAACGGGLPPRGSTASIPASTVLPQVGPAACKGQKATKQYASVTETLLTKGGPLCIPAFGGFGGTIMYPKVTTSTKVTVTSSTSDYDNIPKPITSGSPIFYLNLTISGHTNFTTTLSAGPGLSGKTIKAKATYTVFLDGYRYGFWYGSVADCYEVAKSGKNGGVLEALGTLLKGLPGYGQSGYNPFEVFIYAGQLSSTPC